MSGWDEIMYSDDPETYELTLLCVTNDHVTDFVDEWPCADLLNQAAPSSAGEAGSADTKSIAFGPHPATFSLAWLSTDAYRCQGV